MDIIAILFAVLSAAIALVYIKDSWRGIKGFLPLAASVITAVVVVWLLGSIIGEISVFFVLDFAMLFAILPFYYGKHAVKLLLFLVFIIAMFTYATITYGSLLYQFIEMFAIGTGYGVFYRSGLGGLKRVQKRGSKKVETIRDFAHIALGAAIFAIFLLFDFYTAALITITLIFIGYIYNSVLGINGRGNRILKKMEREDSLYGLGALYLGVGAALIIGFIHNLHFALIGFAALLFADPLATIVGLNLDGPKLPYSRKKSVYGTIAFFLAVAVIGYLFIGIYSLAFAALLAFVESFDTPLDDNISISLAMVIVYVIFLANAHLLPF
ncbi:MAG: hypothetical protein LVQ95_03130 [Candidatus Micrarchaeales archaeon]|nr:hypothetical protein [Candidatus Micrarchaeales archaeon]